MNRFLYFFVSVLCLYYFLDPVGASLEGFIRWLSILIISWCRTIPGWTFDLCESWLKLDIQSTECLFVYPLNIKFSYLLLTLIVLWFIHGSFEFELCSKECKKAYLLYSWLFIVYTVAVFVHLTTWPENRWMLLDESYKTQVLLQVGSLGIVHVFMSYN